MIKKKILIVLTVVTALVVPFSVFAATADNATAQNIRSFFRMDMGKLTDGQKTDVANYTQKAADLQKEFINKMVGNGSMTKEQGNLEIKKVDERLANGSNNGFLPGFGMGQRDGEGREGFRGGHGPGMMGGFGAKLDMSKLSDQQKGDLLDTYKKMADQEKANINKLVTDNFMTKEKGDAASKRIDEMLTSIQKDGLKPEAFHGGFGGMGGIGPMEMRCPDPSKITEQQKTDLADNAKNMAALQKELVNKLVANGVMTKENGDIALKRLDEAGKMQTGDSFKRGGKIGKGRKGNEGNRGRNMNNRQIPATTGAASTTPENANS